MRFAFQSKSEHINRRESTNDEQARLPTLRGDIDIAVMKRGHSLTSLFVMLNGAVEYIKPGCIFRRTRKDAMIETAEITTVYNDSSKILHVRFDVVFEKPECETYREGPRVLAVETFFQIFDERAAG